MILKLCVQPKAYCPFRTWRRKVKSLHGRLILKIGSTTKYLSFSEDSLLFKTLSLTYLYQNYTLIILNFLP